MIQNDVGHTDEHILLNIGIKLAINLVQNICRRRISYRFAAQHAPANRHDERCRNALAGNIGDRNAKSFVVDLDIIEIISAHLPGWDIEAADFESAYRWRLCRQEHALNVPCNLQIVVKPFLFVSLGINDRVIERESRLLRDRLENDKVTL